MKRLLILSVTAILIGKFSDIQAQQKATIIKKIYAEGGFGGSTGNGTFGELGATAIFKNNWTIAISNYSLEIKPNNIPSDYDPGYSTVLFIGFEGTDPKVDMRFFNLTAGRFFSVGRKTWFTAEAGISFVNGEKANFTRETPTQSDPLGILFGIMSSTSNYKITREKTTAIGGMIKADFNWAFCPFAGLGAGVFTNINSIQSPVGFEIKLVAGWMNYPKKHKAK